jgi:putative oxidoreductase
VTPSKEGYRRACFWRFDPRRGTPKLVAEVSVQRLFSMFPNGWPGRGLLLLRLVAGAFLISDGATELLRVPQLPAVVRPFLEAAAGVLFVAGLWTPLAGALVVIVELWSIAAGTGEVRNSVVMATFGAALAMLGPGIRSVDARLFGRKRIDLRER